MGDIVNDEWAGMQVNCDNRTGPSTCPVPSARELAPALCDALGRPRRQIWVTQTPTAMVEFSDGCAGATACSYFAQMRFALNILAFYFSGEAELMKDAMGFFCIPREGG